MQSGRMSYTEDSAEGIRRELQVSSFILLA